MGQGGLPGGAWVEAALGKGGCSLWVISQGTLESCPPPHQLWPAYHRLSQAVLPSDASDFSLEFVIVGSWGDPGGGKVGGLTARRAPAPRLPWVISGLGRAGKVRSCIISSTSLRR